MKQSEASSNEELRRILQAIEEIQEPAGILEETDDHSRAALPSRLIPCVASPKGPGWRVTIPAEAQLAGETVPHVWLEVVAGYVEIWFPSALQQAVSTPISEILTE